MIRLAAFALLVLACLTMVVMVIAGCCAPPRAIPVVKNRDARGRYLTPLCPQCGEKPARVWTAWDCPRGHHYETPTLELPAP